MSRSLRVSELVKREVSQVLHTDYREQAITITITEVRVADDLRWARAYYSVLGDEVEVQRAKKFFSKKQKEIQIKIAKKIVLKYFPRLSFFYDSSMERGNRVIEQLNSLDEESLYSSDFKMSDRSS